MRSLILTDKNTKLSPHMKESKVNTCFLTYLHGNKFWMHSDKIPKDIIFFQQLYIGD